MSRRGWVNGLFMAAVFVYPFAVFFGLQVLPPSAFGWLLAILLAFRFGVLTPEERHLMLPVLVIYFAYALLAVWIGSTRFLLYYPVLVNLSLLALFVWTLRSGQPMLLRIVRARGVPISVHGPRYLYWLTVIWAGFFALNGAVAAWTTTQPLRTWTLYNGLISYLLVALLISVEWLFRIYYKKAKGVYSD